MHEHRLNLDRYLERIGHPGAITSNFETLATLHQRHVASIPFENIDVLLGRGISLALDRIETKLVAQGRGGYCFEQNGLFAAVLRQLGFAVTPLIARVRWQAPSDLITPKTHMILRVAAEGRDWLADVGFGGIGLKRPIALEADSIQAEAQEPRRLVSFGRGFTHQVLIADKWEDAYAFSNAEAYPIDFELANWFTSTHPDSRFKQNLIATIAREDCRISVVNDELTHRWFDGKSERRTIGGPDELHQILRDALGIPLPANTKINCPGIPWSAS